MVVLSGGGNTIEEFAETAGERKNNSQRCASMARLPRPRHKQPKPNSRPMQLRNVPARQLHLSGGKAESRQPRTIMGCIFSSCCCGDKTAKDEERDRRRQRANETFQRIGYYDRTCTDTPMLLLFFLFLVGSVLVAGYAAIYGDPYKLLYGTDSFGNTCGRQNPKLAIIGADKNGTILPGATKQIFPMSGGDMTNKKFLFPLDVRHVLDTVWICVESCPPKTLSDLKSFIDYGNTGANLCTYDFKDFNTLSRADLANIGSCPKLPVHQSEAILNRCIPSDLLVFASDIVDNVVGYVHDFDFVRQISNDLLIVWKEVVFICFVSLAVSLAMVFLIRFFAPILVYLVYAAVALFAIGLSGALWYCWYTTSKAAEKAIAARLASGGIEDVEVLADRFSAEIRFDARTLLALSVVFTIISVLLLVVVWCLWPRGTLVIDLFKQAGKALRKMPCLLIQPVFTSVTLITYFAVWAVVGLYLYTSANPSIVPLKSLDNLETPKSIPIVRFELSQWQRYLAFYHFFALIWVTEFIFAAQRMIIAGAIACWYFARDRNNMGSPVCQSTLILFRYHLGSIAFGSIIITLVKLPRYICTYAYAKLSASESVLIKYVLGCIIALLACIEKCLRYLHHNAYTVIAISGSSFCPAAKTATNILLDNAVNVATINSVGDFVLFLAKAMVAVGIGIYSGYTFRSNPNVELWLAPTAICTVVAYFVASCFVSVYEMIIDTVFLCYAEETAIVARSNGSQDYTDYEFRDFMNSTLKRERNLRRPAVPPEFELAEVHDRPIA
uniref:Choline transporter-like protein n=1 Tax=Panagrellus redivivus TaxID=6233 RepID=A0A7E4UU58_PANRE